MTAEQTVSRPLRRRMEYFFYIWIVLYFLGSLAGLLAGRTALLANETALPSFCARMFDGQSPRTMPLFWSSAGFLLLTVLVSQLPGGGALILLLVPVKAFSTAFVFSIFYMLREQAALTPAVAAIALHAVFLLPAFYFLCVHCRKGSLSGRGAYWLRNRIAPVILTFVYLLLAVRLEQFLMGRLF